MYGGRSRSFVTRSDRAKMPREHSRHCSLCKMNKPRNNSEKILLAHDAGLQDARSHTSSTVTRRKISYGSLLHLHFLSQRKLGVYPTVLRFQFSGLHMIYFHHLSLQPFSLNLSSSLALSNALRHSLSILSSISLPSSLPSVG